MTASELVARAKELCWRSKRTFPAELGAYASTWQRQGFEMSWCWTLVKNALTEDRALWQVEAAICRRYADLQKVSDARQRALCPPAPASSRPGSADQRAPQDYIQAAVTRLGLDAEDDFEKDNFWPAPQHKPEPPVHLQQNPDPREHQQVRRRDVELSAPPCSPSRASAQGQAAKQPKEGRAGARRRRPDSRTVQFIDFLRRRLGGGLLVPWSAIAAQARQAGLLKPDESASGCKPLRYAKRALNIRSRRLVFGGPVHWQIAPPRWASQSIDGRLR